MTKLATRSNKLSNVVVYEQYIEHGHCRSDATVTVVAGMDIGSVVYLSSGKYVTLTATAAGTPANLTSIAIVIDSKTPVTAAGDATLTVLNMPAGGVAGVSKNGLVLGSGTWDSTLKAAVYAALQARGIKVLTTA